MAECCPPRIGPLSNIAFGPILGEQVTQDQRLGFTEIIKAKAAHMPDVCIDCFHNNSPARFHSHTVLAIVGISMNHVPNSGIENPANGAGRKAPTAIVIINTPRGENTTNQRGYKVRPLKIPTACQIAPMQRANAAVKSPMIKCSTSKRLAIA